MKPKQSWRLDKSFLSMWIVYKWLSERLNILQWKEFEKKFVNTRRIKVQMFWNILEDYERCIKSIY
jgi:hypothetical protein